MKKLAIAVAFAFLSPTFGFAAPAGPAPAGKPGKAAGVLQTDEQKTLYATGMFLAQRVAGLSLSAADLKYVQMGLKDAVLGAKPQADFAVYSAKINDLAASRMKAKADKEKQQNKAYLDKMAKTPGATKSASGLVYFELKAGTGAAAAAGDTVKANYTGTFIDGTVFDRSPQGQAVQFPLPNVIKCWQEGMAMMKAGGKAKFVCPSDLAYGDGGKANIPGGATLTFEVELVEVVKK